MPLVLGVHSATNATKVELRDSDDGREYGSGRAEHPGAAPPVSEQDPMDWWHALVEARHDAGGALGVSAVAVAAQQHALVVLDESGRVIRPAKLWNDTEATPDADDLVDALGGAPEWAHAVGSVPDAAFAVSKLAWLRRREPDAFDRIAKVLLPHDWLTFRLSRKIVTDRGDASATGYWSPREERWNPEVLTLVDEHRDWSSCLPRVLAPDEQAGDREGVVISAGTGEAMAAALGLGIHPRDVVVSVEGARRSSPSAIARPRTRAARLPAWPTPPGASCRSCARPSGSTWPRRSPASSAWTRRASTSWRSRRRRVRAA